MRHILYVLSFGYPGHTVIGHLRPRVKKKAKKFVLKQIYFREQLLYYASVHKCRLLKHSLEHINLLIEVLTLQFIHGLFILS